MTFEILSSKTANLKETEEKFSLSFPADYTSFLSKHNGMSIEEACIKVEDVNEEVMMNVLFSNDNSLNRALTLDYWNSEYSEDIPENSALVGDFHYYDHAYNFEESDDDSNTYFLADSFENFMLRLGFFDNIAE